LQQVCRSIGSTSILFEAMKRDVTAVNCRSFVEKSSS
jgi:hypothetical protein